MSHVVSVVDSPPLPTETTEVLSYVLATIAGVYYTYSIYITCDRLLILMYIYLPVQVDLAVEDESFIQFSTPAGKKRRRISFHTGAKIERLSIIPKLEKSFSINDDGDNFEVITLLYY